MGSTKCEHKNCGHVRFWNVPRLAHTRAHRFYYTTLRITYFIWRIWRWRKKIMLCTCFIFSVIVFPISRSCTNIGSVVAMAGSNTHAQTAPNQNIRVYATRPRQRLYIRHAQRWPNGRRSRLDWTRNAPHAHHPNIDRTQFRPNGTHL